MVRLWGRGIFGIGDENSKFKIQNPEKLQGSKSKLGVREVSAG
jgi:hypothetical protein